MSQSSGRGHLLEVPGRQGGFVDIPMDPLGRTPSPDPSLLSANSADQTVACGSTEGLVRSDTSASLPASWKGSEEPQVYESPVSKPPSDPKRPLDATRRSIWAIVTYSWLNGFLVCVVISTALHLAYPVDKRETRSNGFIFGFTFLGIIPLANLLSFATEELENRVGTTLAAFLNVSFGNAVELIIAILALVKCEIDVVTTSLLGSILSNTLLVLAGSFIWGCYKTKGPMSLGTKGIRMISPIYLAALMPCAILAVAPTVVYFSTRDTKSVTRAIHLGLNISRVNAIVTLLIYTVILYYVFKAEGKEIFRKKGSFKMRLFSAFRGASMTKKTAQQGDVEVAPPIIQVEGGISEEEEEKKEPRLTMMVAILLLVAVTLTVAWLSEILIDSVNGLTSGGGVSTFFMALIVIPIVGNAAEHWTAIENAGKGNLAMSFGVALGSSLQIAMFVWPVLTLIAWAMGKPLSYTLEGILCVFVFFAFLQTALVMLGDEVTIATGACGLFVYIVMAITCLFYTDDLRAVIFTC